MRRHLVSTAVTFIANLAGTVAGILLMLPDEKLADPSTWTTSFVVSIFLTAIRQLLVKPPVEKLVRK